jgi:hypothetical protein
MSGMVEQRSIGEWYETHVHGEKQWLMMKARFWSFGSSLQDHSYLNGTQETLR